MQHLALALRAIYEEDNTSWADLIYSYVPPACLHARAGMKQKVLQCYLGIPWGWKQGLAPKGGTHLSHLQLSAA